MSSALCALVHDFNNTATIFAAYALQGEESLYTCTSKMFKLTDLHLNQ